MESLKEINERRAKYDCYPSRLELRMLLSLINHGQEADPKYFLETLERAKPMLKHLDIVLSNMYEDAPELPPQS